MRKPLAKSSSQAGAALVIVLLLIATMSFIAIAISERTVLSAKRSVNARARGELLWINFGAETLARSVIKAATESAEGLMTPETPLFAAPIEFPIEGGGAVLSFADRTRCFNLNSLVTVNSNQESAANEDAVEELKQLMDAVGATGGEGVVAAIIDWIDADSLQEPRGAEDSFYAGLPTPYRTGSAPLADVSELRAISGVDRERYQALGALLCARPNGNPMPINVNMLDADDAPLLAALTRGQISAAEALEVIRARPVGGYASAEAFWTSDAFAGKEIGESVRSRAKLTSDYIEAYAVISYGEATVNLSLLFEVPDDGAPRLISRRLERVD